MHIPDASISPITSLAAFTVMVPAWATASKKLQQSLQTRQIPLLSIASAFCFTIMMFNIPVPGGTTVHPVGGGLLAVLLGPWAAIIGVTTALAIQSLFFGDGGVLALGVNCFTMAFALPLTAYSVYRVLCGANASDTRRAVSAGIGSYVGLNVAALLTATVLGLQPAFFRDLLGHALYFPFGLRVTLPAIMIPHLAVAGVAEGMITTFVVRYLLAAQIPVIDKSEVVQQSPFKRERLWIGLAALIALSPLGILAKGDAWGEWDSEKIKELAGYVPAKMARVESGYWKGFNIFPDYLSSRGGWAYALAALIGTALIGVMTLIISKVIQKRKLLSPDKICPIQRSEGTSCNAGVVPNWMLQSATSNNELLNSSDKQDRSNFVDKTLSAMAVQVQDHLEAERWAQLDGVFQRIDPRAKLVVSLAAIFVVTLLHNVVAIGLIYCSLLVIAGLSKLPIKTLLVRVWLSIPLFSAAFTLPLLLNVVSPGRELVTIWHTPHLAITSTGLLMSFSLTLRIATAVTVVAVLTLTTKWQHLLQSLQVVGVPRVFIVVLAMTYRYLSVLMQTASEQWTAKKSRTLGPIARNSSQGFIGNSMASLFGRTLALTEDVHSAMVSRGWTGEIQSEQSIKMSGSDVIFMSATSLVLTSILWFTWSIK